MRYFFIEKSVQAGDTIVIEGADVRHIRNVLRLNRGDLIGLLDGRGGASEARIISVMPDQVSVEVLICSRKPESSSAKIIIAQAFLKDKKMDRLVRPLTELGMAIWIPFLSERSVARPDDRRLRLRLDRWAKISREALKQCRSVQAMAIEPADGFQDVMRRVEFCDLRLLFWENETRTLDSLDINPSGNRIDSVCAVLGPEGGFSAAEVDIARSNGFVTAGLGPRTLRSETAVVAVAALLQYLYGDMGKKT